MVEEKVLPALAATLGALFAVYAVRKWTRNSGGLPGEFLSCLSQISLKKKLLCFDGWLLKPTKQLENL